MPCQHFQLFNLSGRTFWRGIKSEDSFVLCGFNLCNCSFSISIKYLHQILMIMLDTILECNWIVVWKCVCMTTDRVRAWHITSSISSKILINSVRVMDDGSNYSVNRRCHLLQPTPLILSTTSISASIVNLLWNVSKSLCVSTLPWRLFGERHINIVILCNFDSMSNVNSIPGGSHIMNPHYRSAVCHTYCSCPCWGDVTIRCWTAYIRATPKSLNRFIIIKTYILCLIRCAYGSIAA